MLIFDRQAWLVSIKLYIAAMAALYISQVNALDRPYWAIMTVYIVFNPGLVGAINAKGLHRSLGTLLGCVAVLILVPNFVQTPLVLCFFLSLWLTACLFVSQLNRSPMGYVFMLAGYTASFISFPSVDDASNIFQTVVSRAEEIMLGAILSAVVAAVVFPKRVRTTLTERADTWLSGGQQWIHHVLMGDNEISASRNRMAADLSQLDSMIHGLQHDDRRLATEISLLERMGDRLKVLLNILSSIHDALMALSEGAKGVPDEWKTLLDEIDDWIMTDEPLDEDSLNLLVHKVEARTIEGAVALSDLINNALSLRLVQLLKLWWDCCEVRDTLGRSSKAPRRRIKLRLLVPRIPHNYHFDFSMIVFSSLAAGLSLMAYCIVWIEFGWTTGANGAMIAAVVAAFFVGMDDPTVGMRMFLSGSALACLMAGIIVFGVLPMVSSFAALAFVLGVVLLPLGLLMAKPATFLYSLTLIVNLLVQLTLRDSYSADFETFVNSSLAMLIGIIFVMVITRIVRTLGADVTARRLVKQTWGLLAEAAAGHGLQDRLQFTARMFDLLNLLAPRLAQAGKTSHELASVDMLKEIRLGLNILQVRQIRGDLLPETRHQVDEILHGISSHYRQQSRAGKELPVPDLLISKLDMLLSQLNEVKKQSVRDEALLGLYGMRRTFTTAEPEVS
ncbi:p-hydroxybenzoic acid efflux pump subunit AaeB [Halomonadaceae bacterium LMG 33818]|uniref:FUSC family protein n=1 Tax=Cernens ardua TaxID=3402176 RepID=UPI003EDC3583